MLKNRHLWFDHLTDMHTQTDEPKGPVTRNNMLWGTEDTWNPHTPNSSLPRWSRDHGWTRISAFLSPCKVPMPLLQLFPHVVDMKSSNHHDPGWTQTETSTFTLGYTSEANLLPKLFKDFSTYAADCNLSWFLPSLSSFIQCDVTILTRENLKWSITAVLTDSFDHLPKEPLNKRANAQMTHI